MNVYTFARVAASGRDLGTLMDEVSAEVRAQDATLVGAWRGLFGLRANEAFVMTYGPPCAITSACDSAGYQATVRPQQAALGPVDGLFVFRQFDVAAEDVARVVELSNTAWQTFETADAYRTEPLGLWAPVDPDRPMLLLTWYDGFASWTASRRPAPEAVQNFRERRELTSGTIAFATERIT